MLPCFDTSRGWCETKEQSLYGSRRAQWARPTVIRTGRPRGGGAGPGGLQGASADGWKLERVSLTQDEEPRRSGYGSEWLLLLRVS